jgi:hypothetical protein
MTSMTLGFGSGRAEHRRQRPPDESDGRAFAQVEQGEERDSARALIEKAHALCAAVEGFAIVPVVPAMWNRTRVNQIVLLITV